MLAQSLLSRPSRYSSKDFLSVHYFSIKMAQNYSFFYVSAGDRVFFLLYDRIFCVMIYILPILLSFVVFIENRGVFALIFCKFYPTSRTLFAVCELVVGLMRFIYRISLWFNRFQGIAWWIKMFWSNLLFIFLTS